MKKILYTFCMCVFILASGCTESGPRETLDLLAKAMEENNPGAFLAQINMPVYTENYIKNITSNDAALNSLNSIGDLLGLGSIDNLIGSIVDFRAHIDRNFSRGITTGELMAQCKVATTPDCPWYPASLRDAKIVELGDNAAIASITTPARLTSWLALAKINNVWQVVGSAVLENEARSMATSASSQKNQDQRKDSSKSQNPVNI